MIDYDAHDWFRHFFDVKGSMLKDIAGRVSACLLWAIVVVAVHMLVFPHLAISDKFHSLTAAAIGLLLVFRTNASYDRFWEARKLWGSIINETRNLARTARANLSADPALLARTVAWTIAFPWACMTQLRGLKSLGPIVAQLPPAEVSAVMASRHPPLAIATRISQDLADARRRGLFGEVVQAMIDQNVQILIDCIGACERIHKTPLPFAYVVHLRRTILLYCFTLPFALLEPFGWGAIPVVFCISFIFLGIEEIGVEIEDPFGDDDNDLPLERFCGIIDGNLRPLGDLAALPSGPETIGPGSASQRLAKVGPTSSG